MGRPPEFTSDKTKNCVRGQEQLERGGRKRGREKRVDPEEGGPKHP